MKKVVSLFLCCVFLNLAFCPLALADDIIPYTNDEQNYTESETVTAPVISQDNSFVEQADTERVEHLTIRKTKRARKVSVESVYVSSHDVEIPAQDILQVAFVNDFNGRKARKGDTIEFRFPSDIVTQEGTVIIPSTARVVAEIKKLKKPKLLHLCGKVYLDFKYIQFADGTTKPIHAKLCTKKQYLSRKNLNKVEAVGETAAAAGAGVTTGLLITGASSNLFMLVFGGSLGVGIGAVAGLAVGILLPGASFKAKAGQRVTIQLTQELDI